MVQIVPGPPTGFGGSRQYTFPDSRTVMPFLLPENHSVPIYKLISRFITKDLTKISLPVALNEPLTILQRTSEMMKNVNLLEVAAATAPEDSCKRLALVAIFGIGANAN